ncbi:MAG: hypothetical protein AAFQ82_17220 [Myxococcota bacterium]
MLRLIRNTDWGAMLNLVSPRFFEVLAPHALRSEVAELMHGFRNPHEFRALLGDRSQALHARGIDLVESLTRGEETQPGPYGEKLVELYFWQLYARDACLLDLRSTRLRGQQGRLRWKPSRVFKRWEPEFIEALRELYRGFYDGDDASFRHALSALHLTEAQSLFVEHFGGAEQRAVRFELDAFQRVFHRVFTITQEAGHSLHPNFVSFGVYLGALYENLSRFERSFDVRAAHERALADRDAGAEVVGDEPLR